MSQKRASFIGLSNCLMILKKIITTKGPMKYRKESLSIAKHIKRVTFKILSKQRATTVDKLMETNVLLLFFFYLSVAHKSLRGEKTEMDNRWFY